VFETSNVGNPAAWFGSQSLFPSVSNHTFIRGGHSNSVANSAQAGQFHFNNTNAIARMTYGFRIVIMPE